MKTKLIFSVMMSMVFSLLLGAVGAPLIDMAYGVSVDPMWISGGSFVMSLVPKGMPAGIMMEGLDVEIWKPWIVEQLFANNPHLDLARNADEHVLNGRVVHIPNAGSASGAKKNRSQLPATITRRKDIDVTYLLDEYTGNPRLLENVDKILSYNKMDSAMGQDVRTLKQLVAVGMLYNWRPEGDSNIIETSGSSTTSHLVGSTGNRKLITLDNFAEAQARMDENDIPEEDRYTMLSARMYKQFVDLLKANDQRDFIKSLDPAKGVVGEMFGFKFMKRSTVLRFNNAKTALDPDPEVLVKSATDCDAVMLWQKDQVERAIGTTEIYESKGDPTYYGDIYSLLIRAGGRKLRADGKGVIGIVQKNV